MVYGQNAISEVTSQPIPCPITMETQHRSGMTPYPGMPSFHMPWIAGQLHALPQGVGQLMSQDPVRFPWAGGVMGVWPSSGAWSLAPVLTYSTSCHLGGGKGGFEINFHIPSSVS